MLWKTGSPHGKKMRMSENLVIKMAFVFFLYVLDACFIPSLFFSFPFPFLFDFAFFFLFNPHRASNQMITSSGPRTSGPRTYLAKSLLHMRTYELLYFFVVLRL